jgi:hypothetical protein
MPATPEEEWAYWDAKATELRRGQLATIQATATKWSALVTALLGVFSTVAFAGGLTTVDKLADPWDTVVRAATSVAAAAAVAGIFCLARAAGGLTLTELPGVSATAVRDRNTTNVSRALTWLRAGQAAALTAAVLVLAGSGAVLWKSKAATGPPAVLAVVGNDAVCGPLSVRDDGSLLIGDTPLTGKVKTLVVVPTCP